MKSNNNVKSIGTTIKRLPRKALREEREKLLDSLVNEPAMILFAGWVVLVIECLHAFAKIQPSIWIGMQLDAATTAYASRKVFKARRQKP